MSDKRIFTSESVTEGHPDKVSDRISDSVLDALLAGDKFSRVACETLTNTNLAVIAGEITSQTNVDYDKVVRQAIKKIGYTSGEMGYNFETCDVKVHIDQQSPDIAQGVTEGEGLHRDQGAGDQGMMFGYATNETRSYIPLELDLSHQILVELSQIRKTKKEMLYLRPDSKSQVTIEYNDKHIPVKISSIVISTQHDDFDTEENMLKRIKDDILNILMPKVIEKQSDTNKKLFGKEKYHINPTGKFVIGGPHGDTGLTGRKIIVDTYGGRGAHGGGAFSGKDPSKVDRSAAYATRHIAKNIVAAKLCDKALVQVSYAIGVSEPMGVFIDTFGTCNTNHNDGEIASLISKMDCFNLKPASIISRLKLKNPIYFETAAYGHMGRESEIIEKTFIVQGKSKKIQVETFTWEKLDCVDEVKATFGIE